MAYALVRCVAVLGISPALAHLPHTHLRVCFRFYILQASPLLMRIRTQRFLTLVLRTVAYAYYHESVCNIFLERLYHFAFLALRFFTASIYRCLISLQST